MDKITSLNGLIETLKQSEAKDYVKIAQGMNIPVSDFDAYAHYKKDSYARNCIVKTAAFELILICWKKGDITPIHGHDNQNCWVYQVCGNITEMRYEKDNEGKLIECNNMQLEPGVLTYMHDSMGYHLLENHTHQNSMTLHLYMNPIDSCEVFNKTNNCFEKKELEFYTIDGNAVEERVIL
ncbi:MAG: cysteine dioxygenase family protein [Flavobacteriales bacterium]|nr:cysteine dioxygenase family protein [Flavobacteriales bacterium]